MSKMFYIFFCCWLLMIDYEATLGQAISGRKYLRIGELWYEDEDIPTGGWESCYMWPSNYWRKKDPGENHILGGNARMAGLNIFAKNWTNYKKVFYPYVAGTLTQSLLNNFVGENGSIGHEFKIVMRKPPPTLIVDGATQAPRQEYDELDPNLVSDAMLYIKWSYVLGVTGEMRYYVYGEPSADSYLYIDFVMTNTGNLNRNLATTELPNQFLHGLCFNYMVQPHISYEGALQNGALWENNNDDWVEYYGENYSDFLGNGTPLHPAGNPAADSLRLFIIWDGDNNKLPGDDTGDPDENRSFFEESQGQGRILSPQYVGIGFIHVDKSADDESSDWSQPSSTCWRPAMNEFSGHEDAYKYFFDGPKHMLSPQEMGYTEPNIPEVARPNPFLGVGPFELPFGSDIRFVLLGAVNGLSWQRCIDIGRSWWEHSKGKPGLTDEEKNRLVASGRDSLFKVYSRGTRRFFHNIESGRDPYDIPDPPEAPDLSVTAGPKSVILEWSDVSSVPDPDTGVPDLAGYRVYRAVGRNDTTYARVWECGGNSSVPVTTRYVDREVQRGFAYYYYVTAFDNGSQNWEQPGKSLESGKFWNMMRPHQPVHPYLTKEPVPTMDNIKVVPNPFNDKSVRFNYPGEENKLMFINIPPRCTIKIFTATGDLVKVIEHTDGTNEQAWNQVTDSNQLIYSGVYFYLVESEQGNRIGKFVVVQSSRVKE